MKQTGRYYIRSFKIGRLYLVEPIRPRRNYCTDFGESLIGHGNFCDASITEEESIIKTENNFINIGYGNPMDYIDKLEKND
jgi:hypothetical protein